MTTAQAKKVFLLGFDSMDIALVRRWVDAGELPTFKRLFQTAAWTDYSNPPEITSGIHWSSINSGLSPIRSDFWYPNRLTPGTYRTRSTTPDDLTAEPFWKWFAESGRRIVLADVPFGIPNPDYGGKQYLGWNVLDWSWIHASHPVGLLSELTDRFGKHPIPVSLNYTAEDDSLRELRAGLLEGIRRRTAILKSLIEPQDWDFFYTVYAEPHAAGHIMWHHVDESHPQHDPDAPEDVRHCLLDVYRAVDAAVGELLNSLEPDTAICMYFSHGLGPNYDADHLLPEFLERFGRRWEGEEIVSTTTNDGRGWVDSLWRATIGKLPQSVRYRAREWLPVPLRFWITIKREENSRRWAKMPAFSIPQVGLSYIRVNLAGREPKGRIQPGDEYRRFVDALTDELEQLTNPDTGGPVVDYMFRADQHCDPVTLRSLPDLTVWWRKDSPIHGIHSPGLGTVSGRSRRVRTGEHIMHGMLLISHPDAIAGKRSVEGITGLDIAPTVCEIAGVSFPPDLDGIGRADDFLRRPSE